MTIPSFKEMMLPLLAFSSDTREHSFSEALDHIKNVLNISPEDSKIMLKSGGQTVVENRLGWARTHLKMAGLLESKQRARFNITDLGMKVLSENPPEITDRYLMQFPSYQAFRNRHRGVKPTLGSENKTPLEQIEEGYENLRSNLADDLLSNISKHPPSFFENLVVELLVAMGYGGSIEDAGQTVGRSGDGGIDGIIKEDKLGLDVIYIQAKRWEGNVGSKEIRNFVGALAGQRANKGVFITSSSFSKDALSYIQQIPQKVVLIDGQQLAQLMIDYDIGVSLEKSFHIKRVDQDYFEF
ncbi:MAG TPA: restriction endonuclease [Anaerolineaceae bacterium]|nr:restriction endonuclease [Anaerolineaceae bacterium]